MSSPIPSTSQNDGHRSQTPIDLDNEPELNTNLTPEDQRIIYTTIILDSSDEEQGSNEASGLTKNSVPATEAMASYKIGKSSFLNPYSVEDGTCPLCLDSFMENNPVATSCGHVYCSNCIKKAIESFKECPVCRLSIDLSRLRQFVP